MEGDACKFAVWTGRAPLADHRVIVKAPTLDTKQLWVKRIREIIQEKYLYMEVAMCEPGMKSNRNSKDFELDTTANDLAETCSSAASNSSSGNKVTFENFHSTL
jgi:triple functional domain protein